MLNNVETNSLSVCSQLIKKTPIYLEKVKSNSEQTAFRAALMSVGIYGDYYTIPHVSVRCCDRPEETYKTTLITTKHFNRMSRIPYQFYDQGVWTLPFSEVKDTSNILEVGCLKEYNKKVHEEDDRNRTEYFKDGKLSKVGKAVTGSMDDNKKCVKQLEEASVKDANKTKTVKARTDNFKKLETSDVMSKNNELGGKVFRYLREDK